MKQKILIDASVWLDDYVLHLLWELSRREVISLRWTKEIQDEYIEIKANGATTIQEKLAMGETDLPVLAAAMHSKCNAIVTFHKKLFKAQDTKPQRIKVFTPDEFLLPFTNKNHEHFFEFMQSLKTERLRYKNPPLTAEQYLEKLAGRIKL